MNEYKKRESCAICGNTKLNTIIDYGYVPLAGFFPKEEELNDIKKYHLALEFCDNCGLLQTNSTINPDVLFKDYRYLSSVGLKQHFNNYAAYLKDTFKLDGDSKVIEFGSNDGVLLLPLMDLGINAVGFEPSLNVSRIAINNGCNVIDNYFDIDVIKSNNINESSCDLVTSSNCFAHIDDIHSVVKGIKYVLKPNGYYVFEVHYGKNIIEELQYENVYHEHIYYYTITALNKLFRMYDMTITDVIELPIHSGSIRVVVKNANEPLNEKVSKYLDDELNSGLTSSEHFNEYSQLVLNHNSDILNLLRELKKDGKKIGAYGASGRANILCNFCGIDDSLIDYIIDESPERYGRYINNIPIYNIDKIDPNSDYILIFAWNYSKMIISKLEDKYQFKYIIPLPKLTIINNTSELENYKTL